MIISVDIQQACDEIPTPQKQLIESWVCTSIKQAIVQDVSKTQETFEVCIRIVGEDEIRQLNNDYRHKDSLTNVLSFPFEAPKHIQSPLLGDIAICANVVAKQAQEQQKDVHDHWAHMVIHGTLHLLGFDHISDNDAQIMETLEIEILNLHNIQNPYTQNSI